MKAKTARGWGVPSNIAIITKNVDVGLCGVCTCSWREKHCVPIKACEHLFGRGGKWDEIPILRRLMGKKFPKSWNKDHLRTSYTRQSDARDADRRVIIRKFERKWFKQCRPVTVEVRAR